MRIAVVGSGGLGGYFGGRFQAAGADVVFFARGAHLAALQTTGLRIESPAGNLHLHPVHATDDPTTVGPVDYVLFAVKRYDTESAAPLVPPLIGPNTVVISFQNGIDSAAAMIPVAGRPHVAAGIAYVTAVVAEPGLIRHTTLDRLIFGELSGGPSPRLDALRELATRARISPTLSEQIEVDIWSKFVHLSVFSGMTSVTRLPVGPIRAHADLLEMWRGALAESMAVARARRVSVPETLPQEAMTLVLGYPPQAKSSMLGDLERGRRLELPWLSGAVARMGRELGVSTPIHHFIATVLAPHVSGNLNRNPF